MTAPIDYYGIMTGLEDIFKRDSTLEGITVKVEPEIMLGNLEESPTLSLYMMRRDPSQDQFIAAGTKQVYDINVAAWLWMSGLEVDVLHKARSAWLWKIEAVIMGNRTIDGLVTTTQLMGGDMATQQQKDRFMVGAETVLKIQVDAST